MYMNQRQDLMYSLCQQEIYSRVEFLLILNYVTVTLRSPMAMFNSGAKYKSHNKKDEKKSLYC